MITTSSYSLPDYEDYRMFYNAFHSLTYLFSLLVNTLLLLVYHTPSLAPLELAMIVNASNQLHPELPSSQLFTASLHPHFHSIHSPTTPAITTVSGDGDGDGKVTGMERVRPGMYLLEAKDTFYEITNMYKGDNGMYLAQLMQVLGMNKYSILSVRISITEYDE